LSLAGVDTKAFSGHSTRSAVSSKAKSCSLPVKEILSRGHWSKESVFQRYYSNSVLDSDTQKKFDSSVTLIKK